MPFFRGASPLSMEAHNMPKSSLLTPLLTAFLTGLFFSAVSHSMVSTFWVQFRYCVNTYTDALIMGYDWSKTIQVSFRMRTSFSLMIFIYGIYIIYIIYTKKIRETDKWHNLIH
ncbi:hypothetical protein QBC38DRAFT_477164, partial [Podospora fimiseda]